MNEITKEKLEQLFKELGKEIKRDLGKNASVELVIVGGASILLNYDFRTMTTDVDAMKDSFSQLKTCIGNVGDKNGLSYDWLNFDFKNTESYTPELRTFSKYYKTYAGVLQIYTVKDEYLLCMKLVSFRDNGRDINDAVQLFKKIPDLDFKKLDKAMRNLYGGWERVKPEAKELVTSMLQNEKIKAKNPLRSFDLEP